VADAPGRDVMRNSRLYAAAAQAMDDVVGLDVAVDDPFVRSREALGDLAGDLDRLLRVQGPPRERSSSVSPSSSSVTAYGTARTSPCRGWRGCSDG
jgi:hypothetical protein